MTTDVDATWVARLAAQDLANLRRRADHGYRRALRDLETLPMRYTLWDEGAALERTKRELSARRVVTATWWERDQLADATNERRAVEFRARWFAAAARRHPPAPEPDPAAGTRLVAATLLGCCFGVVWVGLDLLVGPHYGVEPLGVAVDLAVTAIVVLAFFLGTMRR